MKAVVRELLCMLALGTVGVFFGLVIGLAVRWPS